jgi:hypothetical protein
VALMPEIGSLMNTVRSIRVQQAQKKKICAIKDQIEENLSRSAEYIIQWCRFLAVTE